MENIRSIPEGGQAKSRILEKFQESAFKGCMKAQTRTRQSKQDFNAD